MFIAPCFIRKNTKELRDKLYKLGGRSGRFTESQIETILVAEPDIYKTMDFHFEGDSVVYHSDLLIERGYVDCGKNEDLFLALAELRNDSDIGQWFKCGGFIFYCEDHDEPDPKTGDYVMKLTESKDDEWYALLPRSECEKLTVEELIEHLDKKK